MTTALNVEQTRDMLCFVAHRMVEHKEYLGELDRAIGDGDHGIGMSIGFLAALEKLETATFTTVNDLFKTTGMQMLSSMGGASGVIFGSMFLGGVKGLQPSAELTTPLLATIIAGSLTAITTRGGALVGDKTMVDALEPASSALSQAAREGLDLEHALAAAEVAASAGVESTKGLIAKYGRAKSLGDRALGHPDPGAVSVQLIFQSMRMWLGAVQHETTGQPGESKDPAEGRQAS
jgi:dihydroxyacetone kinase phosphoprotein-dependent L subunit